MRSHAQPMRTQRSACAPLRERQTAHSPMRTHAQRCAATCSTKNRPLRERIPALGSLGCAPAGLRVSTVAESSPRRLSVQAGQRPAVPDGRRLLSGQIRRLASYAKHWRYSKRPARGAAWGAADGLLHSPAKRLRRMVDAPLFSVVRAISEAP